MKAYDFSDQALGLLQCYLCNRFQRRINDSFSSWNVVIIRAPQGSILGSFLFNIFWNDIFLFTQNVNYETMPMRSLSVNQEKICTKLKTI